MLITHKLIVQFIVAHILCCELDGLLSWQPLVNQNMTLDECSQVTWLPGRQAVWSECISCLLIPIWLQVHWLLCRI